MKTLLKRHFVGHKFFKCDQMSQSTAFIVKTLPIFLEYIYEFLINTALPASNSVYQKNFKGKKDKEN